MYQIVTASYENVPYRIQKKIISHSWKEMISFTLSHNTTLTNNHWIKTFQDVVVLLYFCSKS